MPRALGSKTTQYGAQSYVLGELVFHAVQCSALDTRPFGASFKAAEPPLINLMLGVSLTRVPPAKYFTNKTKERRYCSDMQKENEAQIGYLITCISGAI